MLACVLLPRDDGALARRLFAVSPLIEQLGDAVFVDVRGTSRLHGGTAGLPTHAQRCPKTEIRCVGSP